MDFSTTSWLGVLLIGLVIGAVAKLLMPGKDPGGCIVTMIIGVAGALLGGYLSGALNIVPSTGVGRFVAAVIGAMILLLIYRMIAGRRRS
jgi:uncharacterized membrane protein YeaQ/YmgE (transglycosylase-associated protein family)